MQLKTKIWNSQDSIDIFDYLDFNFVIENHYLKKDCDIFINNFNKIKIFTNTKPLELKNFIYLISLSKKAEECFLYQKENFMQKNNKIYLSLRNYISSNGDNVKKIKNFYIFRTMF